MEYITLANGVKMPLLGYGVIPGPVRPAGDHTGMMDGDLPIGLMGQALPSLMVISYKYRVIKSMADGEALYYNMQR